MKSILLVSMKKNEVLIKINEEAEYEDILEALNKKIAVIKKLYKEAKNPIRITGKFLKEREMEELNDAIKKEVGVEANFDNVNELGLHGIKKVYEQNVENSETYFFKGGLRSGQKIEKESSIVIIGDVNSGAEIIAGDNIIVLGTLRGLAHAGAKGNKKAIIAAEKIESPQLRIANLLWENQENNNEEQEIKKYAYVENDEIKLSNY